MSKTALKNSFDSIRPRYWLLVGFIIFLVGASATVFVARQTEVRERELLLTRAETIAAGIHDDLISSLTGTPSDLGADEYLDLKSQLSRVRSANPDAHFVYVMGFRDNKLFFYADSEPEESEDISLPGDFYDDASEFKITNAYKGSLFTEGPYTDVWGTWVSGYAPIIHHETGQLVATLGIDISAEGFQKQIWYRSALPATVTVFILIIFFLFYRSRKHQVAFMRELENGEERLRTLYEITTHKGELADQFRAALALGSKTLSTKIAVLSHIEKGKFTVEYCIVPEGGLKEGDVFDLEETYCDMTVKKDDVLSINEMKTDEHKAHVCYQKFALEAYIGVPVKVFGQLHGTLAFMAPDPHHPDFTDSDRDFVRLMGKWMSTMLEREQIEKMKSEFVSVASHQLRTPLTGIKWFAELMLRGKAGVVSPEQKDFLEQIHGSNERMIKLVEELLNVSRIETGTKFEIKKTPTDVVPIIDSLTTDLVGLSHKHEVALEKSTDFPTKYELPLDADKIRQVFANLLSNAVKYSKKGGKVTVDFKDMQTENKVLITVKDMGLGIPAKQQSRMFEKFFRADNVQTAETEGTGLGLYIAKAIIEGHGGKIWFESEENVGTTFFVELPKSSEIS
jgi:signal transduction histidine kinase